MFFQPGVSITSVACLKDSRSTKDEQKMEMAVDENTRSSDAQKRQRKTEGGREKKRVLEQLRNHTTRNSTKCVIKAEGEDARQMEGRTREEGGRKRRENSALEREGEER